MSSEEHGRILLDARVDGLYMAPEIASIDPPVVRATGPLMTEIEVLGRHFSADARLFLRGPPDLEIPAGVVLGRPGEPDRIVANVLSASVFPGVYDVEVENADGQRSVLPDAVEVR